MALMTRRRYQRDIPYLLISLATILIILDYVITYTPINDAKKELTFWGTLSGAFIMIFAMSTLLLMHFRRIAHMETKKRDFWYSVALYLGFFLFFGLSMVLPGKRTNPTYLWMYENAVSPFYLAQYRGIMQAYTVLAAYYAFKVSSLETTVFLVAGIMWLMNLIPLGSYLVPGITDIGTWVSAFPNAAGARGAELATAVGSVLLGLRVLVGKEPGLVEREA